ncbi:MAG: hypothetical protein IJ218_07360 [Alphaproteobacteria bacterium]|nr:hypothetical protein [Alphaproteobacteria bacterium]
MADTPIIIISSSVAGVGKTTLALNLAAALWSDDYNVNLFAPHNQTVADFMVQRQKICEQSAIALPMPKIIDNIDAAGNGSDKEVIIADIPTAENQQYADVFAAAHTLISIGRTPEDLQWELTHPYMNLIWEAKKNVASRGIKYLNWIVVLNETDIPTQDTQDALKNAAKRYGFRVAEPLHTRAAFRYIENGYCAADMAKFRQLFKMSMSDVYARREILTLTDFLWQGK